jgi:23S rRNA pseudouridine1911/1915/1917 synthase
MERLSLRLSVAVDVAKNRLDKFLASELHEISRNKLQSLITSGNVLVNNAVIPDTNYYLKKKDEIIVNYELQSSAGRKLIADQSVKFITLYEDDDVIVLDKPAGIVVHPGVGNSDRTLVNGLIYHYSNELSSRGSDTQRPGIVHRIDKDTSGILVVAKNDFSHAHLARQFSLHSIERKYICFCFGVPAHSSRKIETLIGRDKHNPLKMSVREDRGKQAVSIYRTLKAFSRFAAKVECELKTGRTHQIRVHMAHIGHSLIGDITYKRKNYAMTKEMADCVNKFGRQALHAYFLRFIHPKSGQLMTFEIDMPDDMKALEDKLNTAFP